MRKKLILPEQYGRRRPSRRQLDIIELVAAGLNNREIAGKLGIGFNVVRNHLSRIYDKIGVSNRVELALWYEARMHEFSNRSKSRRITVAQERAGRKPRQDAA